MEDVYRGMEDLSLSSKRKAMDQLQPTVTKRPFLNHAPATKRMQFVVEDMQDFTLDLEKEYLPKSSELLQRMTDIGHGNTLKAIKENGMETPIDYDIIFELFDTEKSLLKKASVILSMKRHKRPSQDVLQKAAAACQKEEKSPSVLSIKKKDEEISEKSTQITTKKVFDRASKRKDNEATPKSKTVKITRPKFPYPFPKLPSNVYEEIGLLRTSIKVHWKKRKTECFAIKEE